jgi:hypothetical protein
MDTPDETTALISAGRVQGTDVYNAGGEKLGDIYDLMLDKRSGRIAYAIMAFGGILGIGKQYHPLPWQTLKYDTYQGGYVVGLTRESLEKGPAYGTDETPAWGNRTYEQGIHDHYGTQPYWASPPHEKPHAYNSLDEI